jgi:hypothetical protein
MGRSDEKPMEEQLQALWEEQGEMIVGVPQGVRDLLNSAFAQVPVLSFPKLPYGKGIINYSPLLTHPLLPKSSIESIQQEIQDASSHEELLSNHSIDHSVMGVF